MQKIPISLLEPYQQLRLDLNLDIEDIASSFQEHGQFSPIGVRIHPTKPGKYQVIFGNRRLAAAKKLGWSSISAEVFELSDIDASVIALSENLDRKDLSDYEKALVLQDIHEKSGKSFAEIAQEIGKSPAFVAQHVAMLHLFTDAVGTKEERERALSSLTEKHARALMRIEDPNSRWNTAKLAVVANLSAREIEKIAKKAPKTLDDTHQDQEIILKNLVLEVVSSLNTRNVKSFFDFAAPKSFTMFGPDPPSSELDIYEAQQYLLSELRKVSKLKIDIQDIKVRICNDFAYVTLFLLHQVSVSDKSLEAKTRGTIILEKARSSWQIVHEHWSTPYATALRGHFESTRDATSLIDRKTHRHLVPTIKKLHD